MYIVAGLGNPGPKYAETRHNLGFITIDRIAADKGVNVNKLKFRAVVGEFMLAGQKVMLVKPQTYMNLSGESVGAITSFYKIPPERLILIYDDMDIPVGTVRIRKKGSAGSHNGMRSVVTHMHTENFPRIRIGIGSHGCTDAADYVLGNFSGDDKEALEKAVLRAVSAVDAIVTDGIDKAMNMYNGDI